MSPLSLKSSLYQIDEEVDLSATLQKGNLLQLNPCPQVDNISPERLYLSARSLEYAPEGNAKFHSSANFDRIGISPNPNGG